MLEKDCTAGSCQLWKIYKNCLFLEYCSCVCKSKMEAKCSFGLLREQECHKLSYTRRVGLKKLTDIANDTREVILWRAGLLENFDFTHDGTICFHHECLFGSKFERKEML